MVYDGTKVIILSLRKLDCRLIPTLCGIPKSLGWKHAWVPGTKECVNISDIKSAINSRTRVISISHVGFDSGFRFIQNRSNLQISQYLVYG